MIYKISYKNTKRSAEIMQVLICAFLLFSVPAIAAKELSLQKKWSESLTLEAKGDFKAALSQVNAIKPPQQWAAQWHARRAWLLYQLAHYQSSYLSYKKSIAVNAHFLDASTGILLPLVKMNRWQEVLSRSQEIIQDYPSQYTAHYYLCLYEQKFKKWPKLLKRANNALELYPMSVDFMILKARALDYSGDVGEALDVYSLILIVAPNNPDALTYISTYMP